MGDLFLLRYTGRVACGFINTVEGATMSGALLTTKLHIPQLRPNLVSRPRLIKRLDAAIRRTRASNSMGELIRLLTLQAVALDARGRRESACSI
jgi:hypothetical protein